MPIAFETYGRIGETALKFVKNLITQLVALMTNGGRDLGLQTNLLYLVVYFIFLLYKKEIVNYRLFYISNATHSNILTCFSVNELQS